jgi:polyhydroxyalkanoate synthesis regulator phasin
VLAAKVQETEGELARLHHLEANHLTELNSMKKVEQEKVDSLNQRLGEVDEKCQKLSNEMATQSKVLSEMAKRWVEEISALDHGLAGTLFFTCCISPFSFRLLGSG